MTEFTITGAIFKDMFLMGAALLEKNKSAIDALNVFPVPDGDTGTNMLMTMQSAVKEMHGVNTDNISDVAAALSLGALKGARGNSGVILSQIFRGISKRLKGATEMDAVMLAEALRSGSDAAYKAVMRPKEGTMLTVMRMIAEEVSKAAVTGANVYTLVDLMIESGENALKLTPELLPVLKEAGVVDSGGKGLLTIFTGLKMVLDGAEISDYEPEETTEAEVEPIVAEFEGIDEESIKFGYCTEFFIIHLNQQYEDEDIDKFREKLMRIGDSVVVAHDGDIIKVHVHSNSPGKAIQFALRLGEISKLKIDNMREQFREKMAERREHEKEMGIVAVSMGEGIEHVFTELSADYVVAGGQTMNPSIEDIAKAIQRVNARNIFVLPNNSNIILAAQQAQRIANKNVAVIPTKTIPQGIKAMMAFNPDLSFEENAARMEKATAEVKSGTVTYAVRDTALGGLEIHEGDIIGLNDGKIVKSGTDVNAVAKELLEYMIGEDGESVSIFYGETVTESDAKNLADELSDKYDECDFVVQYGGQPLYYYIFSVE
jgi:DAK2 domain fusion protein YloV